MKPDRHSRPQHDVLFYLAVAAGPVACWVMSVWIPIEATPEGLWQPLSVVLFVILYPVAEEWLFRGRIQPALAKGRLGRYRLAEISAANLVTSLIFAALHLFNHPPVWAAMVILPSLLFGLFRDRYGVIGPSIALHAFYNACYLVIYW